jgi:serine phosphatase RsbU (regulator of sigma subunit)
LGILAIIALFAIYAYRQVILKRKANIKLHELNKEIEKKNQQILDSISYASHIQEAILPVEQAIRQDIPDSFILFKPRDIVSGDFYWHARHENLVFIAAIDCTGHGVPGAFMSMIGNTLLNEIVNEMRIFKPSEVLKNLNEKVIFTLNQDSNQQSFSEDGMDITFCCYDRKNNTIEIALANHTACLIRNGKTLNIEGDIFSIGGNIALQNNISYTNYKFDLNEPTTLYMYSDGYQDQFGGNSRQKYMANRFVNFLSKIQGLPFENQKEILLNEYESWRGTEKQIDDVLVIGLQFKA